MKLSEANYDNAETGCCAKLDTERWDENEFTWQNKRFLKDHVRSLFHIPVNFGAVMTRDHAAIEAAEGYAREPLWLTDEVSPWRSDIYMAVDKDIPNADMDELSGTYLTKVFEGPFGDVGKWTKSMQKYVSGQGRDVKKMYYFYATCPKCAKHYGKNQVVLFAKVD